MKKCGYSFWGYLGDVKYTKDGKVASTPDGNAFYSWCIIRELQKRGYEVIQIMPDRDAKGFKMYGGELFGSWLKEERKFVYMHAGKVDYYNIINEMCEGMLAYHIECRDVDSILKEIKYKFIEAYREAFRDMEFVLHEYRMLIPGRNDKYSFFRDEWQPDYFIQECLFDYCCEAHKKLILFDLDYKMDYMVYESLRSRGCPVMIFELGNRWSSMKDLTIGIKSKQVFIPFDFDNINYFSDNRSVRNYNLVYVGNRYERDWCIDKYIPKNMEKCIVYGNWLEGNRDTKNRWPSLYFGQRIQVKNMRDVYVNSVVTILLAKKEYCESDFMTARIIEAIFYGTVPLFIEEYGEDTIKRYAGRYAGFLTVRNEQDVMDKIHILRNMHEGRLLYRIIEYMRDRLKFMDVKYFVNHIEEAVKYEL